MVQRSEASEPAPDTPPSLDLPASPPLDVAAAPPPPDVARHDTAAAPAHEPAAPLAHDAAARPTLDATIQRALDTTAPDEAAPQPVDPVRPVDAGPPPFAPPLQPTLGAAVQRASDSQASDTASAMPGSPAPSRPLVGDATLPLPSALPPAAPVQRATDPAPRRLGLGAPIVPPTSSAVQVPPPAPESSSPAPGLPLAAPEAGASGTALPDVPSLAASPTDTPPSVVEAASPNEVTPLLGDVPLVQRTELTSPPANPLNVPDSAHAHAEGNLQGVTPAPQPLVQRAVERPVGTESRPAEGSAEPPVSPAPLPVVAQLVGDRGLPLKAAPEPERPASNGTPHPAAQVQRWTDPYGTPPHTLQRSTDGGSPTSSNGAVSVDPPTSSSMSPGWLAPPPDSSFPGPAPSLPSSGPGFEFPRASVQRFAAGAVATVPAPGAPHPGWSSGLPVAAPPVQRVPESATHHAPPAMQIEFGAGGVPVVSRATEEAPAPEPAPATAPATESPASAPQQAQAPAAPGAAAGNTPEELLAKLFDPLLRRLKTELRLDRERRGSLTDLRH